jgi:hypothetical protein
MRNARRFPNMEVVNAAVADFDGTALLVPGGEDTSTFHVVASPRGGPALSEVGQAAPHVVPVLGLDSWSEKGGFPRSTSRRWMQRKWISLCCAAWPRCLRGPPG